MDIFKAIYLQYNPNVFVIGGGQIYNYFLNFCNRDAFGKGAFGKGAFGKSINENTPDYLIPQKIYITEVNGYSFINENENENDTYTYMNDFRLQYRLNGFSQKYKEDNLSYRICFFTPL